MAQGAISEEINRHIGALLVLSKRDILWHLVHEAELCMQLEQISASAILAGIALEELSSSSDLNFLRQSGDMLESWRGVRNRAAHPTSRDQEVDPKAVAAMVSGIRAMLDQAEESRGKRQSFPCSENTLTKIQGKYGFVPTSVKDFLNRKRLDVDLETRS